MTSSLRRYGSQSMVAPLRRVLVRRPDAAFAVADPDAWHYTARPDLAAAQAILADAVTNRRGILIVEGTQRSPIGLFAVLIAPLIALLITPRIRPFHWRRLIFTYVIPLVPLGILFDGVVSCLRTYTPAELRALANAAGPQYDWAIGELRTPGNPLPIIYALGLPPEHSV
jgi:MFS family permease